MKNTCGENHSKTKMEHAATCTATITTNSQEATSKGSRKAGTRKSYSGALNFHLPVGDIIPVLLLTSIVIPVSRNGTEKSMTLSRAQLILRLVITRSVSWRINSATSPFHEPLTIPPH